MWKSTRTNGVDEAPSRSDEALPRLTDYHWPALGRSSRARRLRTLALAETSAAFTASGPSTQQVFQVMARRLANRVDGGCLIRPRTGGHRCRAHGRGACSAASQTAADGAHADEPGCPGLGLLRLGHRARAFDAHRRRIAEGAAAVDRGGGVGYLDACDISSFLVVPLRSAEQIVGTVALWRERPGRKLDEDDQLFAEEVGRRLVPSAGPEHT